MHIKVIIERHSNELQIGFSSVWNYIYLLIMSQLDHLGALSVNNCTTTQIMDARRDCNSIQFTNLFEHISPIQK